MSVMNDARRQLRAPRAKSLAASPPSTVQTPCGGLEAAAVARYIADMAAQLETMAIVARLDLLAYFLAMARAEGETSARGSPAEPKSDAPLMV